jgi:hypothetical protein
VLFCDAFFTIPDFVIDKGVGGSSPMIYDKTKIFVIKSDFYDGFGFVIKIFVIEVDISSSESGYAVARWRRFSSLCIACLGCACSSTRTRERMGVCERSVGPTSTCAICCSQVIVGIELRAGICVLCVCFIRVLHVFQLDVAYIMQ